MFRVLITGADGFVGKALCAEMVSRGWNVRASVRSREKIKSLPEEIEVIETGLIGPDTEWKDALDNVESVVHLAGRVHIMDDSSSDPLSEYRIINTAGTEKLARSAASSGIRRFIFMSTVKVNGEGREEPYNEEDVPGPVDPYGISKWEAEEKLKIIGYETGMETVIIRAPMVYGPGVKANFIRLIKAVDRGIPMPFLSVNNRRSLIYFGNLVDSIIACLNHQKAAGQTYLVSDNEDVSTPELIRQMEEALGKPARLFYLPLFMLRLAGVITGKSKEINRLTDSLAVDSSKIRKELGWNPPFTLAQGLKETSEWYKKTG
ncbi:MAG: SDR family oxidoreductase [Euryarchaeota archaeon]|nr:SDR family oxidoreductase [Euryarchaeota archaeon]